jgi:hypothetical protein
MKPAQRQGVGPEQRRYARVLEWGARAGLAILVVEFALYLGGMLPVRMAPAALPEVWSLPLGEYLARTGAPTGWGWIELMGYGDFASLSGIAILASCSVPCLLAVAPLYLRNGDRVYAILCLLLVAVLVLAASGLLGRTH